MVKRKLRRGIASGPADNLHRNEVVARHTCAEGESSCDEMAYQQAGWLITPNAIEDAADGVGTRALSGRLHPFSMSASRVLAIA